MFLLAFIQRKTKRGWVSEVEGVWRRNTPRKNEQPSASFSVSGWLKATSVVPPNDRCSWNSIRRSRNGLEMGALARTRAFLFGPGLAQQAQQLGNLRNQAQSVVGLLTRYRKRRSFRGRRSVFADSGADCVTGAALRQCGRGHVANCHGRGRLAHADFAL